MHFLSHVMPQPKSPMAIRNPRRYPTTKVKTRKKSRTKEVLSIMKTPWSTLITTPSLRNKSIRPAKLARWRHLLNLKVKKSPKQQWSHLWSPSKRSQWTMITFWKRLNSVIRCNRRTSKFKCGINLAFPPFSKICSKPTPFPNTNHCHKRRRKERSDRSPKDRNCRMPRKSPSSTSWSTQEKLSEENSAKPRRSMMTGAPKWQSTRKPWWAFSTKPNPANIWLSARTE